ncbi:Adenylate kinase family protein [Trichomonas vaginalis G3]|uniref:Adenylate kinase family protein n=1 Tax=Trichomonas vaginalis (strain ATCC PRA-98 / G3) TaxID=412133 RepID=A2DKQ8_TRIV3|nr:cytidylate kinase protein [Trichomonas vaginalis G3]EAY19041.1 Adenylate kinase family protein [Trichomonas vaginalis G3]KAI5521165.1 cytidylate kinase protein [Trichomonas vaginalis G3]|eukprot:XP_001580027.1 Adenylate kinase family protein [Trichomonas vaginalis G3]
MRHIEIVRKKEAVVERGPKVPQKQKVIVLRRVRPGEEYTKKEEIPVSIGIPEYYKELQTAQAEQQKKQEEFHDKTIIFIIGGPGSGKGTQSEKIIQDFNAGYMSAGELLRKEAASDTELGHSIAEQMKEGKILPQELVIGLLKKEILEQGKDVYLIDGFPRAMDQLNSFEETITPCSAVIYLDVPDEILTERLLKRAETSGREDDNEETIKLRLEAFHTVSAPVLDYYKEKGKAIVIDGNRAPEEVYEEIKEKLNAVLNKETPQ